MVSEAIERLQPFSEVISIAFLPNSSERFHATENSNRFLFFYYSLLIQCVNYTINISKKIAPTNGMLMVANITMKKIFYFLFLLLGVISVLSAQSTDVPDNLPISAPPNTDNPPGPDNPPTTPTPPTPVINYPIGTIAQPVVAGEYCTFLTDTLAPEGELSLETLKEKFGIVVGGPITCDGFPNNYNFYWDLDRTTEVIDTVPSKEAQQLFNKWRSNPYSQELLDYMLDTYYTDPSSMGSKTSQSKQHICYAPSNILQLYPNSTTLAKARSLALCPVGGQYLLYNERYVSVINSQHPINPKNFLGTTRYQVPQPDYHRPVLIAPKI